MSGEMLFLIYYCGMMVVVGIWANGMLKKEFAKMNSALQQKDKEGISG